MDIKKLEQILGILKIHEVTDFELEYGDTHIRLSRSGSQKHIQMAREGIEELKPAIMNSSSSPISHVTLPGNNTGNNIGPGNEKFTRVESPLVGTFYRKSSPSSEPFVREADVVKKGDTLCIVEAMKLMNEIESPCDGRIEKVLVNDGQVVEYGEVLFLINPAT